MDASLDALLQGRNGKSGKSYSKVFFLFFSDACFLDGVNVRSHSISIVFRGKETGSSGSAKAPPIFLEISKIIALSTTNTSRSNHYSALQKNINTQLFSIFNHPWYQTAITINAFWFWKNTLLYPFKTVEKGTIFLCITIVRAPSLVS